MGIFLQKHIGSIGNRPENSNGISLHGSICTDSIERKAHRGIQNTWDGKWIDGAIVQYRTRCGECTEKEEDTVRTSFLLWA